MATARLPVSHSLTHHSSLNLITTGDVILSVFAGLTENELERDLDLRSSDAEAWSVTVNKRTLKNMSAKEIKRQDTIWGAPLVTSEQ